MKVANEPIEIKDCTANCSESIKAVVMCFPTHKTSMTIQHNDHKSVYISVSDWIKEDDMCDWESEEEKQRAIDSDELWTIQWYPKTPVSFCAVAASTLESALAFINKDT